MGLLTVGPAGAAQLTGSAGAPNTLTFSGAAKGTLSDGPQSGCQYGGINSDGTTELGDLVGTISGFSNVKSWSLTIGKEQGNGTFKVKSYLGNTSKDTIEISPTLNGSNFSTSNATKEEKESLFPEKGTLTLSGDSGSINATMTTPTGKTIKVVGSWKCK